MVWLSANGSQACEMALELRPDVVIMDIMNAIRTVHRGEAYLYPGAAKQLMEQFLAKVDVGELHFDFTALTAREREIVSLIAKGFSNREIGEALFLSIKTVEAHKSKVMEKLQLRTRQELVSYAFKHGLLHFD
ncbi:MAG TPA: LuxR C-terminal-related transcriptional regulator [Paenibacillus sp.]|uniref:response regulator transcription factor n=1 Tax=Paenibacillus sp. TaxID=58172 RepID=UPI0028D53F5B|nr:LuxR C-terminal-related transcriptional regulator [Paenibacillus sp.]HUC92455.1 LuxR C-terminal-related transcriptional regulator [Paenibacillus sp.]